MARGTFGWLTAASYVGTTSLANQRGRRSPNWPHCGDVADPEPLPPDHPLWSMSNVLITPHVAIYGTPYREKWEDMLIENCRRFAAGQPLLNVVDKEKWF